MPTYSPQEGLSGLQESGATLTPEQLTAQAGQTTGLKARLAATAAKVGPLLTAATLLTATGCSDDKTDKKPESAKTATDPQPEEADDNSTPDSEKSGPFAYKAVCEAHNLLDSDNTPARQNYRRMFVQMVVAGEPVLYEPCADSNLPGEVGKFVDADCKNEGNYRTCTVKDSYTNNRYEAVNTETQVRWLLNGQNKVESPNSVQNVFSPYTLNARKGQNVMPVDPSAPVVYGQREQKSVVKRTAPAPTPTAVATSTKKLATPPTYTPETDKEQNRRLDNLEAQVAYNTSKNDEQDIRLDAHDRAIQIMINANSGSRPLNPHPTNADLTDLGSRAATGRN